MFSLISLVVASLAVFVSAEEQHHWHPRHRPCVDSSSSSSWSSSSSSSCSSSSSSSHHRRPCCGCPKEKGLKWAKEASQEYLDLLTERIFDAAAIFQTDSFQSPDTVMQCPFAEKCFSAPQFGSIYEIFENTTPFERGPIVEASYQHDGSILVSAPYNFYIGDNDSISVNVLLRWIWTADCLLKVNLAILVDVRCPATLKVLYLSGENSCPTPSPTYIPPYITTTTTETFATGTTSVITETSTITVSTFITVATTTTATTTSTQFIGTTETVTETTTSTTTVTTSETTPARRK